MKLNWIKTQDQNILPEYRDMFPPIYICEDTFLWVDEYGLEKTVTRLTAETDDNGEIENLYVDYKEDTEGRGIDMCKHYSSLEEIEKEFLDINNIF